MSTHLGDGKSGGKTGDSSQMTENKRRLALARSYTQSSKNPKNVTSLGLVNSSEQIQSNITVGTTYEVLSQITGTIVYQGQLTELAIDYPALIAALSIQLNIPASNLRVSVRAGSVIIDWSTIVPIIKTYTPPDVRTIVSGLQESLITNPIAGISLVNGGSVTASITKTATNSTVLSMPEGVLEYVLSATDTTIRVNGIPPGTYPYTENSGISGILGTSHVLPSLRPDTLYTITIGNGRSQAIRTARSFTLAAAGRDVTVSGLASNTTYLYSVDSGLTWLILAANRVIPNVLPGLQTIQIMVQNLVPNIGVGVASATVTVTLGVPSVPTYTFQGQNATFTVPTLPYLNAAGYVYTLNIVNTTNSADTPAPSTVNSGSATVRGFILTDTYTASVTVTSADGVHTATSPVITLLLPPTPPPAPIISVMSPTSLKIQSTGLLFAMTYEYSVDDGASWKTLTTPGQTGLSTHIADGLVPGRTYSVRIRAINTSGSASSVKSNSIILPAGTPTIVPTSITSLMISNIGTEPNLQYFYSLNGDNPVPVTPVGSSTQTVSNLSPATQYSVQIWIVNPAEPTAPNNISAMSNTIVLRPSAPATPTLSVNGNIVTLTNTDSPVQIGCSYSYILTTAGVAGTATPLSTSSIPLTLAYNTAYSVTVTATSLYDSTIFSTSLPSITRTTPPATPTSPTVTASGNTITITNTDAQSGCQYGYQVLNGTTQVMNGTFTGTNTATTSGLAYNTTYTVTVTATNVGSTSTSPVSITTPLNTPSTPTFTANDRSFTITNTDTPQPSSSYSYTIYYGANTVWNGGSFSGSTPVVVNGAGYNTQYRVVTVVTSTLNSSNTATSLPAYAVTPPVPLQTPTLTVSGNTITIKNNDNQLNCAYTYKVLQGTTTFTTGSIPGGGTASAMNAAYNTAYTVTVTATTTYTQGVNVSATSSAASITTPVQNMSVPAAPTFTASGTTLTLTNADTPQTSAAYTYTIYSAPGVVWRSGSFTGTTAATVTGASNNTQYSAITTVTSTIDASKTANSVASYAITSLVPLQAPSLSASGTTLTVTNNDNQQNCAYTYKVLQGTTTFATGSIPAGGTVTAPNASLNTTYSVTVTATTTYTQGVNVSATSSEASLTTPTITVQAPSLSASGTTLTVTNNDNQQNCSYTYKILQGTTTFATGSISGGGTVTAPNASLNTTYSVTVTATTTYTQGVNVTVTSSAASITTPNTITYNSIDKPIPAGGFTLASSSLLTCTLIGGGGGMAGDFRPGSGGIVPGGGGGSLVVQSPGIRLKSGSVIRVNAPSGGNSDAGIGEGCNLTVVDASNVTQLLLRAYGGNTEGNGIGGKYAIITNLTGIAINLTGSSDGTNGAANSGTGGVAGAAPAGSSYGSGGTTDFISPAIRNGSIGYYSITITPISTLTISTPTLNIVAGSTSLTVGNIDNTPGYTYAYSIDGDTTYTPVTGSSIQINNVNPGIYVAFIKATVTATGVSDISAPSTPVTIPIPTLATPVLNRIVGSYTTLLLSNITTGYGLSYSYTLDNGVTYIPVSGNTTVISNLTPGNTYTAKIYAVSSALPGLSALTTSATSAASNSVTLPILPTPSTPTLQRIAGSYSTLLLGNVDSVAGLTYYYRLSTQAAGTRTAISNLEKSGNGYIVSGLVPNLYYAIVIVASPSSGSGLYGPESSLSSPGIKTVNVVTENTPILSLTSGVDNSITVGNIVILPELSYYYSLNNDVFKPFSGSTIAVLPGKTYSIVIQARVTSTNAIFGTSDASNSVTLNAVFGTVEYSYPSNPIPAAGFTLTQNVSMFCTLKGAGGGSRDYYLKGGQGGRIDIAGFTLPSGTILTANSPIGGANNYIVDAASGDDCNLTITQNGTTKAVISALGGGGGVGQRPWTPEREAAPGRDGSDGSGVIIPDLLGITSYATITPGYGGLGGVQVTDSAGRFLYWANSENGSYTITLVPTLVVVPKPSTPTLQTIPGSYTTLLLGNVDSTAGYTYYYTLNTQSADTRTAISNLEKSGSGYIVTGLVPNQDYTIGITAKYGTEYGPISTYSSPIVRTAKTATPTLSLIPGSATTLLVGNVENVAGYTYYYSVNGLVFDNVVPLSRIITGLNYATTYVVYIEARSADNISNISLVSNSVTTPFPVGTLRYRYDPSSIYSTTIYSTSFPDFAVVNQTGDISLTLTQDMILTATIIGAGGVTPQGNGTVEKGGRINITNMRLSAGVKVNIRVGKEARMHTDLSITPTGQSSITETSLLRAGGGQNLEAQYAGVGRIIFDAYGTSPYTTLIPEGGIGSSSTGAYYIQLVPA